MPDVAELGESGDELRELARDNRRKAAEQARRRFAAQIAGAQARESYLSRDMLKTMPFAVADLMFIKLLTGELVPRNAGEAAQVARLAVEVGRAELGESTAVEPLTAKERDQRIAAARALEKALAARRGDLERQADDSAIDSGPTHVVAAPCADV